MIFPNHKYDFMSSLMFNTLKVLLIAFIIQPNPNQHPSAAFHGPGWYFCSHWKHFPTYSLCPHYSRPFLFVFIMYIFFLSNSYIFYIMCLSLKYFSLYTYSLVCVWKTHIFHHINFTHVADVSLNPIFRKAIPNALTRSSSSIIKF